MAKHAIILSHHSARAYWLSSDAGTNALLHPSRCGILSCPPPDEDAVIRILDDHSCLLGNGPTHILVSHETQRRHPDGRAYHVCATELPRGSFCRIEAQLYVTSPELSYLLMGRELSLVQMAEFATNLCASYYVQMPEKRICPRTRVITTPNKLRSYVDATEHVHGRKQALEGLRWAAPGSASPMETKLYLRLCVPSRMGGYGLPAPRLNHVVDPGRYSSISEKHYYVADLCWPEYGVIVEYDGEQFHVDASRDKRRVNALEMLGWKVFCATRHDMFDAFAFDRFARQVAKAVGKRIRVSESWAEKTAKLQKELGVHSATTSQWRQGAAYAPATHR